MTFLEDRDLDDVPSIKEYYKGKTILITGGSGFMGRVLVEKLLYSCTELDRIYLLLRSKKKVKPVDRLADLHESSCFDRLRKERPGVFQAKVFHVTGDIGEKGLGLSDEDRTLIINRVNIVFHVAASVRFNDTLEWAARLNIRGTKEIVELAKEMRHLESFVHVSTSYANTNKETIDEVLYPPHADWRDTLAVCESLDPMTLTVLTPKYLGELPNTYVFTKQLAEHLVYEHREQIPAVILRPSIVVSSQSEPIPGWNCNLNGPVGLMTGVAKGILRTTLTDPNLIADYMPVDLAIRSFITAAWIRGTKKFQPTDDISIYNVSAGSLKTLTVGDMSKITSSMLEEVPFDNTIWVFSSVLTTSRFRYNLSILFEHLLPAIFIDTILLLLGKKPILVKSQRLIYNVQLALQYYTTQQWTFRNNNFVDLRKSIKEVDKKEFYYDVEGIDSREYLKNAMLGTRKFVLKEKDEDMPKARAHCQRLKIIQKLVHGLFFGLVIWWLWNTDYVQNYILS